MQWACAILSSVVAPALRHFSTLSHKRHEPEGRGFDGAIGIFHSLNSSGHTMALGSTKSLTEISSRGVSLKCNGGRCVWMTTLPPSRADCLEILGVPNFLSPEGRSRPGMG